MFGQSVAPVQASSTENTGKKVELEALDYAEPVLFTIANPAQIFGKLRQFISETPSTFIYYTIAKNYYRLEVDRRGGRCNERSGGIIAKRRRRIIQE